MTKPTSKPPAPRSVGQRRSGSSTRGSGLKGRTLRGGTRRHSRTERPRIAPVTLALGASPAGFLHKGNRFATVKHVLDPAVPTKSGKDLSIVQLQRLTLRRLKLDRHFVPFLMLGVQGSITRKRALEEVKALSYVGRHLIELDQSYLAATLRQHRGVK